MAKRSTSRPSSKRAHRGSARKSAKGSRKKKTTTEKANDAPERPTSSLIYNPQVALEELLEKYNKISDDEEIDGIVTEVSNYESRRVKKQPVIARMGLSRSISRFGLPMDLKDLEDFSPQEYLRRCCYVCKRRQNYYKKSFDKFDKDRDGLLSFKEMERALSDVYTSDISPEKVQQLTELILANDSTVFDCALFSATCALSERLFYTCYVTEDTEDEENKQKHKVEEADFCSLLSKIKSYNITAEMKRLLSLL
ncbi:uncharacterized protein LOC120531591 [Polypterus senegalus]|uniref:uncharacterized protein LOC120531591 n=1 Tax=Polypterus senegalus TaxID=55291 RepID=UPI0019637766|nr:uncharacterized protein LOC120531591 [Polypterus senegalus]